MPRRIDDATTGSPPRAALVRSADLAGEGRFEGDGTGIAVADFDRDGVLDVYATSLRQGASRLYRDKGDGTFADVSEKAGVLLKTAARSCAWSDINGDGWPDLFVTCPKGPNILFRNRGDGTFTNIAPATGYRVEVTFPATGKVVVRENVAPGQRLVVKEE